MKLFVALWSCAYGGCGDCWRFSCLPNVIKLTGNKIDFRIDGECIRFIAETVPEWNPLIVDYDILCTSYLYGAICAVILMPRTMSECVSIKKKWIGRINESSTRIRCGRLRIPCTVDEQESSIHKTIIATNSQWQMIRWNAQKIWTKTDLFCANNSE